MSVQVLIFFQFWASSPDLTLCLLDIIIFSLTEYLRSSVKDEWFILDHNFKGYSLSWKGNVSHLASISAEQESRERPHWELGMAYNP